jgi:hypothetical protein
MQTQTIIMTTILISLSIIVINQHLGLRKLYKSNQEQQEINAEQTNMNQAFSLGLLELRGKINRATGVAKPIKSPNLPEFIEKLEEQKRFIRTAGVKPNAN